VTTKKLILDIFSIRPNCQPRVSRSSRHTQVMLQTVTLFYIHCDFWLVFLCFCCVGKNVFPEAAHGFSLNLDGLFGTSSMLFIYQVFSSIDSRAFRTSESADFSEVRVRKFRTLKTLWTRTQHVCLFTHLYCVVSHREELIQCLTPHEGRVRHCPCM
jgi:hypothetical protein